MENEKGTEVKTGLTAEEKENQIDETVEKEEGEPLTENEEWNILMGKGIEFKAEDLTIIVPPIKIKHIDLIHQLEKKLKAVSTNVQGVEALTDGVKLIADIVKVPADKLSEKIDKDDLYTILQLLTYSFIYGKKMYNKKKLNRKELDKTIPLKVI